MQPERTWNLTTNPAWRAFTDTDQFGYLFLLMAAALLVILTIWTYVGSANTTPRRLIILIVLRLLALLIAILTTLRPSAAVFENPREPSTLILVIDSSESMSVNDEANYTRWEVVQKVLSQSQPLLQQLKEDQQVTIYQYHFNRDFDANRDVFTAEVKPDGKATDFGSMLSGIYAAHQSEKRLRGLVIFSDGRDNKQTSSKLPLVEAAKFRSIGCPIYTFAVGSVATGGTQKDIGFTSITPNPSPVAIKAPLKIYAKINAPGFVNYPAKVRLKFNDQDIRVETFRLTKENDNEIEIETKAPDQPGEVKVRLELVDPPDNQSTTLNDAIETYLNVTKEGVRVLVLHKDGFELQALRRAIARDKRFDVVEAIRVTESLSSPEEAKAFDLREQRYDVIILGDVSAASLTAVRPTMLEEIRDLVKKQGVGLVMTGGAYTFGGTAGIAGSKGYKGTPIEELLPVLLPPNPVDPVNERVSMVPTEEGLQHFLMRLDADRTKNKLNWDLLNGVDPEKPLGGPTRLPGRTVMGEPRPGVTVFARADNAQTGAPMLVGHEIGSGRVLAFAASETYFWTRPYPDPSDRLKTYNLHSRFWRQMILWLAKQDETEGAAYVRPEFRRMVSGSVQRLTMGLKDKRGTEIPDADLRYQVLAPGEMPDKNKAQRPTRDEKGIGRVSYETKNAGEYRVVLWAEGKDPIDGSVVTGDATASYLVTPEITDEMLRTAANPDFLLALENTANGTSLDTVRRADRFPSFLKELIDNPLQLATPKSTPYPDWRRDKSRLFLPIVLVIFVLLLGLEWGLRRAWGMV